jgi:hypothetical protein
MSGIIGDMAADTSRVMIPALAGLLSASPTMMAASTVVRNVENIVSPELWCYVVDGERLFRGILSAEFDGVKIAVRQVRHGALA